jgi:hypothetical protein
MKQVYKPEDMPKGPHFAIVVFKRITGTYDTPGDTYDDVSEYHATTDRTDWEREIGRLEEDNKTFYSKTKYVALVVQGMASVKTSVVVNVSA